jgi:hypothetical protein
MVIENKKSLVIAVFCVLLSPAVQCQSKSGLTPATQVSSSTSPRVDINQKFTKDMADEAGLDPSQPMLSADGLHFGTTKGTSPEKVASTECLFVITVVKQANKLDTHEAAEYCTQVNKNPKPFESLVPPSPNAAGSRMEEALVHIVVWNKGQWSGTWYQYERTSHAKKGVLTPLGKVNAVSSPPTHLVGRGVGFLAIHLNIDDSCGIGYEIKSTPITPLNRQDVNDLITLAEAYIGKGKPAKGGIPDTSDGIGVWGGQLLLGGLKLPASIQFTPSLKEGAKVSTIDAAKSPSGWKVANMCSSTPAPSQTVAGPATAQRDRFSIAQDYNPFVLVSMRGQDATPKKSPTSNSSSDSKTKATPSAGTKSEGLTSNPLSGAALTIIDEGFHWWDVSVAMPVTSYNQLKFDSVNNILVVKNTNDVKPYALFDAFLGRQDLRMQNAISKPFIAAGLPMAGKPLQKTFYGAGLIFAVKSFRIQPIVGVRVEKDLLTSLTNGQPATPAQVLLSQHSEWHAKLQVMIGFSVGDAAKVLGLSTTK